MTSPKLLYLDAYDSFSNNIIALLQDHLHASVTSIKIDDARFVLNDDAFFHFLDGFDAVVAGPGPGHPGKAEDVGLIAKLWDLPENHLLPVLGICLGFQSLCLAFGLRVERLREPRHGLVTPVTHCEEDLFKQTSDVLATQYHSLHVRLGANAPGSSELWQSPRDCQEILPLAWDLSDAANGPILMAAKHTSKPFWGVQYHPESICTNESGKKLVQQWWREVCICKGYEANLPTASVHRNQSEERIDSGRVSEEVQAGEVHWQSVALPAGVDVVDLVNVLRDDCGGREPLVLESGLRDGMPVNPETGQFSIIGLQDTSSTHIRYSTNNHRLQARRGGQALLDRVVEISHVFEYLDQYISERRAISGPGDVPFWGGLVGFVSYEASLETLGVEPADTSPEHPDVWFVFVEQSVVVDHINNIAYIQTLIENDDWLSNTAAKLKSQTHSAEATPSPQPTSANIVAEPAHEAYTAAVQDCQSQLRAGESYELCLTDSTHIRNPEAPWSLYRRLRHLNPAPFGAYLHFQAHDSTTADLAIASSSPERFLSWSPDGTCEFRPIKGTVKKGPGMTREKAEAILRSPKEQAENLMIVDLIRHDLSGVKE